MNEISQIDWAKLAAYIDGEGCIQIQHTSGKTGKVHHMLSITVSNTDPRLSVWCKSRFGGCVQRKHLGKSPGHRRPAFNWFISSAGAERVLLGCLDHFVIKREEAEIALAFRSTIHSRGGDRKAKGEFVTADLFDRRESFRTALQHAKRGFIDVTQVQ